MEKFNIWDNNKSNLEKFEDERGIISDIFYKENINHVAIISSKKESVRGNHWHKFTIQHTLVTKGKMEYWYKPVDSDEKPKSLILNEGDMISTPPNQIHALLAVSDNETMIFTEGPRGGADYENDTFRVEKSIIPNR